MNDLQVEKLKRKIYERELAKLHEELVVLQKWVVDSGQKVCVVFEGRDGAGKGGTIKAITERVSPRVFHVVALPAPTEREKSQMYVQRYIPHLPAAGEIVIFDRSWYNRAGVERVLGFCTEEQAKHFLQMIPGVEKAIVDDGVILRSQANLVASRDADWSSEARETARVILDHIAARARASKYREVRTRFAGCDAAVLAEAHNRFGVVSPFGGPTSSGMVTLHCPPAQLYALSSFLRARGAETVSVASLDYVLDRDNPLFTRLEAFLRQ